MFGWAIAGTFLVSLAASLFFKETWLWMDETTSITLLADPSFSHLTDALVSALDAHPPLFFIVYWPVSQLVDLNPYVLKILSISVFTTAIVLFFRFTTRLVGKPAINFFVFTVAISLTYLNYTLSTQIRSYCLFLLMACLYFMAAHRLVQKPAGWRQLAVYVCAGAGLVFVHNFGVIYLAASLSFFGLLLVWSGRRAYGLVMVAHGLVAGLWFLLWFPRFQVQSHAGQPHTWIPLPTFLSFFRTLGELVPSLSFRAEQLPALSLLPLVRVGAVVILFLVIAVPRLKKGADSVIGDPAFSFYLMAGWMAIAVAGAALVVSLGYMSVWISRFQWPSELLLLYQFAYACNYFFPAIRLPRTWVWGLPLYVLLLTGFMFYQNRKIPLFSSGILAYLSGLNADYPVFFESADYFLPIWHHKNANAYFLLNWPTALATGNLPNATVDFNILKALREKYNVAEVVPMEQFTKARFPHFYVVDESTRYLFEHLIATRQVRVVRVLPVAIKGHRILECTR